MLSAGSATAAHACRAASFAGSRYRSRAGGSRRASLRRRRTGAAAERSSGSSARDEREAQFLEKGPIARPVDDAVEFQSSGGRTAPPRWGHIHAMTPDDLMPWGTGAAHQGKASSASGACTGGASGPSTARTLRVSELPVPVS
jgi:hypothetical protein